MVAQTIEPLTSNGCKILHDIPGDDFDLDHVLIGPTGIFVIETKARSKPCAKPKVTLVNEKLLLEGNPEMGDSRGQAQAAARWLEGLILRLTGEKVYVQPVVVFPEWFVDIDRPYEHSVWVCNPKGLLTFIPRAKGSLPPGLMGRIHHALVEHVMIRQQMMNQLQ